MADNKGKAAYENPFELQQKTRRDGKKSKPEEAAAGEQIGKNVFKWYKHLPDISNEIAKELNGTKAYKDIKDADVSKKSYKDIIKKSYKDIMDEGLTFFMSTDPGLKRTGLLSLIPALLTGIRLYSEMSKSESKNDLLEKIKIGIEVVFKFIYRDADWRKNPSLEPVFDASPYESEAFYPGLKGRSYIDSISWAVPLFLKILNLKHKNLADEKNKESFVFEDYRDEAKKLIKWCLDYVNGAVLIIDAENENFENKPHFERPVGWNFSKMTPTKDVKAQRSLYFTYAAASMYLSLYEEYKDIIDNLQTLNRAKDEVVTLLINSIKTELENEGHKDIIESNKAGDEIVPSLINFLEDEGLCAEKINSLKEIISLKEVILLKKNSHFEQVEKAISTLALNYDGKVDEDKVNELQEALGELKKYKGEKGDKDKRRKLDDYYYFNDEKSAEYNGKIYPNKEIDKKNNPSLGSVSRLKWNLEKISTEIWEKAKDKLEDNFVYDDFNFNIATTEAIQSGGQTNALFAGLLYISICLYSKYDFVVFYTKDDSEKFGKKAYDNMQNIMLLHVQRAQRFFDKLEKNKAFGVDFLILRFPENFSGEENEIERGKLTDSETAERLRKQLIRITSLTPMLLKTNNLISQYVVQYPQKQMGESLVKIGEKRFYDREEKKSLWIWESDGYHAMSNYYYVGAIFDFYAYYYEYEDKYRIHLEKLKEDLSADIEYTKSVQAYYQKKEEEIVLLEKKHKEELNEIETQKKAAEAQAKEGGIGKILVENISEAIKKAKFFDEPEFLKRIINGIRNQLAEEVFNRYPKEDGDYLELKTPNKPKDDSFFSLLQALAADIILQSAIEESKNDVGKTVEKEKGLGEFAGQNLADIALNGGKQLIDGKINKLFVKMCAGISLKETQKPK